jgi:hypothetical protein
MNRYIELAFALFIVTVAGFVAVLTSLLWYKAYICT